MIQYLSIYFYGAGCAVSAYFLGRWLERRRFRRAGRRHLVQTARERDQRESILSTPVIGDEQSLERVNLRGAARDFERALGATFSRHRKGGGGPVVIEELSLELGRADRALAAAALRYSACKAEETGETLFDEVGARFVAAWIDGLADEVAEARADG